jgi:hypothetical protein
MMGRRGDHEKPCFFLGEVVHLMLNPSLDVESVARSNFIDAFVCLDDQHPSQDVEDLTSENVSMADLGRAWWHRLLDKRDITRIE